MSVHWQNLCVILMLSVRTVTVASPVHVQRAMREMESIIAKVHAVIIIGSIHVDTVLCDILMNRHWINVLW